LVQILITIGCQDKQQYNLFRAIYVCKLLENLVRCNNRKR